MNYIILQHIDGVNETNLFYGKDWFDNSVASYAWIANGRVNMNLGRDIDHLNSGDPRLFESEFPMTDATPVTNIVLGYLTAPAGNSTTFVLAVSATAGGYPINTVSYTAAQNVYAGGSAQFSVVPSGGSFPNYQWLYVSGGATNVLSDGAGITGSQSNTLTINNVSVAVAGYYQCLMTNPVSTNLSPLAPLTLVRATGSVMNGPSDAVSDFGDATSSPAGQGVAKVEDGTLASYVNYGLNGGPGSSFRGPVGFIDTPAIGISVINAMRVYVGTNYSAAPADYGIYGTIGLRGPWTFIAGGALPTYTAANLSSGQVNSTNEVMAEVEFANSSPYISYAVYFTNLVNDATVNGLRVAEVQLLGTLAQVPPIILRQPQATQVLQPGECLYSAVVVNGSAPYAFQWYADSTGNPVASQTNASLSVCGLSNAVSYFVVISNQYGSVTSSPVNVTIAASSGLYVGAVLADNPIALWRLDEQPDNAAGNDGAPAYDSVGGHNGYYTNTFLGVAPSGPTLFGLNGSSSFPIQTRVAAWDTDASFAEFGQITDETLASPAVADNYVAGINGINFGVPANTATNFSVEAWIYPYNNTTAGAGIVAQGAGGGGEQFVLDTGGTANGFRFFFRDASGIPHVVSPDVAPPLNAWTHVVGVLNLSNNYEAIYTNGILAGSNHFTFTSPPGVLMETVPITIGSRMSAAGSAFDGQFQGSIADVAIYPYALSGAQVLNHYSASVSLVSYTAAQNVYADNSAQFSVVPPGGSFLSYQWLYVSSGVTNVLSDGAGIAGSQSNTLTIANVSSAMGYYQCVMTNPLCTNISPLAPLTIATANGSVMNGPTDAISDFGDATNSPAGHGVAKVADGTLASYVNYGLNGGPGNPFRGPVGFIGTPAIGISIINAMRVYMGTNYSASPADYGIYGSSGPSGPWTFIAGGSLPTYAAANLSSGQVNSTNEVMAEVDFANTSAYASYRVYFTNIVDDTSLNGLQVAEVQLLGSLALLPPGILKQPPATQVVQPEECLVASVLANGPLPLTYQWYSNSVANALAGQTNATLSICGVQSNTCAARYFVVVTNAYGSITSSPVVFSIAPSTGSYVSTILADNPLAFWRLDEQPDNGAGNNGTLANDSVGEHNGYYANVFLGVTPHGPTLTGPNGSTSFSIQTGFAVSDTDIYYAEFGQIVDETLGTPAIADNYVGAINGINLATANTTNFSVEAWVYLVSNNVAGAAIVAQGCAGDESFVLDTGGANNAFRFLFRTANGTPLVASLGLPPSLNAWCHLVGVANEASNTISLYINGMPVSSSFALPSAGVLDNGAYPISIGSRQAWEGSAYNNQLQGSVANVAIYPYALSGTQVSRHYQASGDSQLTTMPSPIVPAGLCVNIHNIAYTPRDFQMIRAAGWQFVRTDVLWELVETTQGVYDFSLYDQMFYGLQQNGLRLLGILGYANSLYGGPGTTSFNQGYANFAAAVVAHYARQGVVWELWNEPNNANSWPGGGNPTQYMAMVSAAVPAMRQADPTAPIVSGGVAYVPSFQTPCFQLGLLNLVDGVSLHPYVTPPESVVANDYTPLRNLMLQYHSTALPILSTEWGWTRTDSGITAQVQGDYLARMYLINLSQGVPLSSWYDWMDGGTDPNVGEENFGTVNTAYTPYTDYQEMQLLTSSLQGLSYARRLTSGSSDYLMVFTNSNKQTVAAWTTGSSHSVTVLGQSVSISSTPVYVTTESLSLASSLNPETYGNTVTFTATVNAPGTTPTGTVTFKNGAIFLSTAALNAGVASLTMAGNLAAADSPYTITATYSGDANYASQTAGLVQTVNRLPVVLQGVRPYDGTAIAAFSTLTVANALGSDDVNLASGVATLAGSSAGPQAISSVGTLALGGTAAVNYTLAGATGSVTVDQAALLITAQPQAITYGAMVPATTVTYGGFVNGDTSASLTTQPTIASARTGVVAAGTYTSNYTAFGAAAANYAISYVSGALTVNPLAVMLDGTKAYDATTNAAYGILFVSNAVGSDDVNVTNGACGLASADTGTNAITSLGTLVLGGTTAGNYTLTGASGSVVVTALAVALSGTRPYDGTNDADSSILTITNDLDGTNLILSGSALLAGSDAGTNSISDFSGLSLGGTAATNYTLTNASGSVVITPVPLTITAGNQSKTYGTALPLGTTAFSVGSGLVNSETVTAMTLTANGGTWVTDSVSNSPYTITPSAATGAGGFLAANYNITYNIGALTVNPLPVVLTSTRAYDGTKIAANTILVVANAVGSDDVNVSSGAGSATLASASVGPQNITDFSSLTLSGETAGNYTLTGASGTVTVTNPFNSFSIGSSLDVTGTNLVVCWQSVPGVVYSVLTNSSLTPLQTWAVSGGPITATNITTCYILPGGISSTSVFVTIKQQ